MKFNETSFLFRLIRNHTITWVTLVVISSLIINSIASSTITTQKLTVLIIVSILVIYVVFVTIKWNKYLIIQHQFSDANFLEIEYLVFDKLTKRRIDLTTLNVEFRPLPLKGKNWRVDFKEQEKLILSQTTFGWEIEKLRQLFITIVAKQEKELSLEDRINLKW